MKNRFIKTFAGFMALIVIFVCFTGFKTDKEFDTSLPDLDDGSWTETFHTDFTEIENMEQLYEAKWAPAQHGLRNVEYWCEQMIDFSDEGLIIHSERQTDHECDVCGASEGIFTSGIDTRIKTDDSSEILFSQAYGYFEATVIVPRGTGMWSAFWLQSDYVGKVGHKGKDGSEIDIYESSFMRENPTKTGQAIHYDAYNAPWYRSNGNVADMKYDLYDGQPHKYALKWAPDEYVIYVDDTPVWASNYGGVSQVPEFLRLTVEIRPEQWGPYSQQIGDFVNHSDGTNDFIIKEVKVYQNKNYTDFIKSDDDFKDMEIFYICCIIISSLAAAALLICVIVLAVKKIKSEKAKNK